LQQNSGSEVFKLNRDATTLLPDIRTQRSVSLIGNNEHGRTKMLNFDTTTPVTAIVNIPAGQVHLTAADRSVASVDVRPANAAKNRDVKAAEAIAVDYTGGVLRISAPDTNQILGPSGTVEVTVQLPADSRVEAVGAATDFAVAGRFAEIRVETAKGDLTVTEAGPGKAVLRTQAGSIAVSVASGVSAALDAGTEHGRIENSLKNDGDAQLDIHATTAYGDIVARGL
jgi:hypothetical protein